MVRDEQRSQPATGPDPSAQLLLRRYSSEFVLVVSPNGEVLSGSHDTLLGYDFEQLGTHVGEYLHPDDLPQLFAVLERARSTPGYHDHVRVRARHADGSWRQLDVALLPPPTDGPFEGNGVLRIRDITDEGTWSDPTPAEDQDRFLSLAESLPLGILSADARGWVVFCNEAAQQIFNLSSDRLRGHGWEQLIDAEDRPEVEAALSSVLSQGLPQHVKFRIHSGLFGRWASAKFVPMGAPDATTGWIATVDDITDSRRAETELTHRATHDGLTGLPNRMLLEDRLQQACARLRRETDAVAVLFIDLNGFKSVNDRYGHTVGDQVLVEVATRLRLSVRQVDTVARLGGDEFVIFCEGLPEGEVDVVVGRLHDAMAEPFAVGQHTVAVGASIGVEITRDQTVTFDELLARADQAMYRQKRNGPRR